MDDSTSGRQQHISMIDITQEAAIKETELVGKCKVKTLVHIVACIEVFRTFWHLKTDYAVYCSCQNIET